MRIVVLFALLAIFAWVVLLVVVWRFQERVVFQPPQGVAALREQHAPRVSYPAADGVELAGYMIGDVRRSSTLLLAFHGNAELARWMIPWAEEVERRTGVPVFLAEYRGYDGLKGPPNYEGARADARGALAYLRDTLGIPADRIAVFGHSLGSAVAAELAAEFPARVLVLQAPFTSAREMARRLPVPGVFLFWRMLSRVHFDTRAAVARAGVPVWVIHGDRDRVIPVEMGLDVYANATRKGELEVVRGAGHNDVPEVAGAEYWEWMARALGAKAVGAASGG